MRPDLINAVADLDAKADAAAAAGDLPTGLGYNHASRIVRLFQDPARVLRQLRQHAGFWKDSSPEKSAAYREAAAVITHHTGETLAAAVVRESYELALL